ncbi:MAG TPA: DNA-binding domain-containing protein [Candidatus Binataceae bacterium]|nr:DNA-binding domain-containing protein [Candidatus Binataceae bacterium]
MLADLQALLYRLITAPSGVEEGLIRESALPAEGLDALICGDNRLSARERVSIYANAYFHRLLSVFKEDFPRTCAVLGDINFHNLITGYLIEYPPYEPSLLHAGRNLAEYLADHPLLEQFPFAADLARLERATVEVFHGPDHDVLRATELSELGPEAWPSLNLRLHPAAQILELQWRVDKLIEEAGNEGRCLPLRPEGVTLLVWRHEWCVRRRILNAGERAGLKATIPGADFASVCAAIAAELAAEGSAPQQPPELPLVINRLLSVWLGEGVLAANL